MSGRGGAWCQASTSHATETAALGAHDQAVAFLEQALPIATDPADRAAILEQAGEEAAVAGRHDKAEQHLRDALELRRRIGDRPAIAVTTAALGRVLNDDFRTTAALGLLEPAARPPSRRSRRGQRPPPSPPGHEPPERQ